ncbi:MAG: sensor histidine kinase [Pseudomonadota bacterium]
MSAAGSAQVWPESGAPGDQTSGQGRTRWLRFWRLRAPRPRLWVRLWAAYAALCLVGISCLMIASGALIDTQNYFTSYTEQNIADRFNEDAPLLRAALALPKNDRAHSVEAAAATIASNLLELQVRTDFDGKFLITSVSDPRVRVTVFGADGEAITQAAYTSGGVGPHNPRRMSVLYPIEATDGRRLGEAQVDYAARYNLMKTLRGKAAWAIAMSPITAVTSIIIGLMCGLAAAHYVTSRLRRIDAVTSKWRLGDFSERITLASGDELETHAERLNAMAMELQTFLTLKQAVGVAEERNRIARDLHDTVKQKLFALGLQLAVVRAKSSEQETQPISGRADDAGNAFAANISEAEAITREAQRDVLEIITQLRPATDASADLIGQIRPMIDDYERRFDVKISLSGGEGMVAAPHAEINLVRIIQEAIANAIRHGRARLIQISFRRVADAWSLKVEDDGVGFDPQTTHKGLGIQSIEQRANELPAGRARYSASHNGGATLTVSWSGGPEDGYSNQ